MRATKSGPGSRRRGGGDGEDDSNRWLGTYGDAITLLMAFFVMLYAMSSVEADKFEAFVRGLQDPFGNTAASQGLLDAQPGIAGEAADATPGGLPNFDSGIDTGLPPGTDEASEEPSEPDDQLATQDVVQLEQVQGAIVEALQAAGLEDLADFRFDSRGLVMSLATDDVLFASGSTVISELGRELVGAIAEPISHFSNDIFVEGHTDNVPINRGGYTNWNLSTDRAVAVVNIMAQTYGLDEARLGAAGYAEFRPRAANDSDANRALNRRVDILIVAKGVANG